MPHPSWKIAEKEQPNKLTCNCILPELRVCSNEIPRPCNENSNQRNSVSLNQYQSDTSFTVGTAFWWYPPRKKKMSLGLSRPLIRTIQTRACLLTADLSYRRHIHSWTRSALDKRPRTVRIVWRVTTFAGILPILRRSGFTWTLCRLRWLMIYSKNTTFLVNVVNIREIVKAS